MNLAVKSAMLVVLTATWCLGLAADGDQSVTDLKAKAESAKIADQPKLFLEIARRQLEATEKAYAAGETKQAEALLKDVSTFAEKAGGAATKSGKQLKHIEIEVRKMSRRLSNTERALTVEERPPVQDAIDKLEHVRTEMLTTMFSKN